jgi:predicted glycosyltransferase
MRRGSSKTVLYFILDWGLGHATRSMPVIRGLLQSGFRVVIVSTGRSLALLRREFSRCEFEDLPDYGIRYSRLKWALVPRLCVQMPGIFFRLIREHRETERLARRFKAAAVVSDNRYGCFSARLPSYFITHQLRFQLPPWLAWSAWISEWFNRFFFRHYTAVWVPDEAGSPNLSGDLSHKGPVPHNPKVRFVGPLSSLDPKAGWGNPDVDILFLISGPEPQRTGFEKMILAQAAALPGRKAAVLGKPDEETGALRAPGGDLEVFSHLEREKLAGCMKRAEWIVCRSGYSTVMELAAFGAKAILVPTPGQTEQEYLAAYLKKEGLFFSVRQDELDLKKALPEAGRFYSRPAPAIEFNRIGPILARFKDGLGPG